VGDLVWVEAHVDTPHGKVGIQWERQVAGLQMEVTIPANCSASVYVPTLGIPHPKVYEGQEPVWHNRQFIPGTVGIHLARLEPDYVAFEIGSGYYRFAVASDA
jgi:alpha-L-rhamnosidase